MNSRFLFRNPLVAAATLITLSAASAYADRLVLISQTNGQFDYGVQIDPNHGLTLPVGNQITLTNLFGVTTASVLPDLSFAFSILVMTPTSVTIADTIPLVLDPLPVTHTLAAVRVISSVSTTGPVNYLVQTGNEGTLAGTTPGPVAPVPEPGEYPVAAAALAAFLAVSYHGRVPLGRMKSARQTTPFGARQQPMGERGADAAAVEIDHTAVAITGKDDPPAKGIPALGVDQARPFQQLPGIAEIGQMPAQIPTASIAQTQFDKESRIPQTALVLSPIILSLRHSKRSFSASAAGCFDFGP